MAEEDTSVETVDTSAETGGETSAVQVEQPVSGNPAWSPFRDSLDPITFSKIEPHLSAMDKAAQERITSVNKAFQPYKQFADSGLQAADIQRAVDIRRLIDENPQAVFDKLKEYLRTQGAPGQQSTESEDFDEENDDPRFQQMLDNQQRLEQYIKQQAYEQEVAVENDKLSATINQLQQAHPELKQEDVQEILSRAASVAQQTGRVPSLEDTYQGWYAPMVNRFRTEPRPGDSAPKLVPTSGGLPSSGQAASLGQMKSSEVQDYVANFLTRNKS